MAIDVPIIITGGEIPPAGTKEEMALIRIRAIVNTMPRAYAVQDIKAELAAVLGPFQYQERKPCP